MILDRYLQFVEHTEPPVQFHRWAFLSGVAAMLGRRVYIPFGHSNIYPNMYTMLVGPPGTKKSSSINIVKKLIEDSEYDKFSFSKTTKQKFLLDWSERTELGGKTLGDFLDAPVDSSHLISEMFCCLDEFIDFIGVGNFEFLSLLTTLWDCPSKYDERVKNSTSVTINQPTLNLLGGITPVSLAMALPNEANGQGFFSRILMVYANDRKKITWPSPPDQKERQLFVRFFRSIRERQGVLVFTPEAKEVVDEIYHKWENRLDVKLEYYASRRLIHMFKILIALAVCSDTLTVDADLVVHANTLLCYTEKNMAKALSEFGTSRNITASSKILEALAASERPLGINEIWKQVIAYFDKMTDMAQVLTNLQKAGKIMVYEGSMVGLLRESPIEFGELVDYERYIKEYKRRDGKGEAHDNPANSAG